MLMIQDQIGKITKLQTNCRSYSFEKIMAEFAELKSVTEDKEHYI